MTTGGVGILGVGVYLPDEVRTNDWWPERVVERWRERQRHLSPANGLETTDRLSDGERCVVEAVAALGDDPFQGCRERRVLPAHMETSDMEVEAARAALRDASLDPTEIDLVLVNSTVPDHLVTNNACLIHEQLGLPAACFSMSTEAACNSFQMNLTLAEQLIRGGKARSALLVLSCTSSRLLMMEEPFSPWFGDGAAAVVVGPTRGDRGILAQAHRTNGKLHRTIVAGVRGSRWWEEGRVTLFSGDPAASRIALRSTADDCKEVMDEAFARAGVAPSDVAFFAPHQPSGWFRRAVQRHLGLEHARFVDTYPWTASLFAANIPLGLFVARREGLLRDGDLVAMVAGGAGITFSASIIRWGR